MRIWTFLAALGALGVLICLTSAAPTPPLAAAPAAIAPTGGCTPQWQIMDTPNPGTYGSLSGVAAVAPNDVWAMGTSDAQPLTVHWDGQQWTQVPVPPAPYRGNGIGAGAAIAGEAWMVGTGSNGCCTTHSVAYHWDGSAWNLLPELAGRNLYINGVAAIGPGAAWVVGANGSCNHCPVWTLIMRAGPTTLDPVPSPNRGTASYLNAVAVSDANDAWSVGSSADQATGTTETLVEHWDGTAWTIVPSANISGTTNVLTGVAVAGPNDVWAVGGPNIPGGTNLPFIEHWDGTAWSIVPSPGQPGDILTDVSASSPTNVWAVGTDHTLNTLALHWDGTAWTRVTSPAFYHESNSNFNAVAALGPTDIWAVGSFYQPDVADQTLVAHYTVACPTATPTATPVPACLTGWQDVSSPRVGSDNNQLQSIAAVTDDDLWAVGQYGTVYAHQPLIEHRVGGVWGTVPSPNPGTGDTYLYGVSAVAANDVWAVGTSGGEVLTEHWDGSSWTVVPAPSLGHPTALTAIAARTADDIWAVGLYQTASYYAETLTIHWNGTAWSVVPTPTLQNQYREFYGVSILGPNDVWAVGYNKNYSINITTVTAHWDGTAWTIVPSPNAAAHNVLWGVAAVARNDVWAVGEQEEGEHVLIEHWDGTGWTIAAAAPTGGLYAVAARAANDIWAVGKADHPGHTSRTMHWDGTSWATVPGPGQGSGFKRLRSVVTTGTDSAWAVGSIAGNGGPYQSLIGRYYGPSSPCLTPTPNPSSTPTWTPTNTVTATPAPPTNTVTATETPPPGTPTGTPMPTACTIAFVDVPPGSTFYDTIRCLACRGIVGGYPCGGPGEPCPGLYYRPGSNVTRGQTAKIVASVAGFTDPVPSDQQTFEDVAPGSTFGIYVERLATRGVIGGYPCGGPFEPCVAPLDRPYFRPNNAVTRGQLAKITSGAALWTETPTGQLFADAPPGSTFYLYVERMASRGIISGYPCGGASEPCVAPANRPYFRPNNNATRGQMSKIAASAFLPNCQTPAAPVKR